jgi:hypothetical protein
MDEVRALKNEVSFPQLALSSIDFGGSTTAVWDTSALEIESSISDMDGDFCAGIGI